MAGEPQALEGLRIIDFSRVLAGPLATMVLGDLGADVVKVEHPDGGDDTRTWGPPFAMGTSTYFLGLNRNKRSITLDLSGADDLEVARNLCLRADVVVDNFRSGTMSEWGLDFHALAEERPDIVTCSITGFGNATPHPKRAGYDLIVQAASGIMSLTGPEDGPPYKVGVALLDKITGLYAAIAILSAIRHRDRTGDGQPIEISLMEAALASLLNSASSFIGTGMVPRRTGNRHPSIAPYQPFETQDGTIVVAAGSEKIWHTLCTVVDREDLKTDPRFITNEARVEHVDDLEEQLTLAFRSDSSASWIKRLRESGIPAGQINDIAQAFDEAAELNLNPIDTLVGEAGNEFRSVRSPMNLGVSPPSVRIRPPDLGEHDNEIRSALLDEVMSEVRKKTL